MAAFSHQHHPFLLDSLLLTTNNIITPCFSHFYQPETFQEISGNVIVHDQGGSCLDQCTKVTLSNNNNHESCHVTNKTTTDSSSSITDKVDESGDQVSQKVAPMDNKRKNREGSSINSAQSKKKRASQVVNGKKRKKSSDIMKNGDGKDKKDDKKLASSEVPTGYIHVRARRGQATDSHSLAERVRREKISERMKILQALVPGCDKVTGKALMLDEIINYVQSLQHQVEFLSMKLASVNPMFYDFGVDLDALMMRTDQRLNGLVSPPAPAPASMQPCNGTVESSVISGPNNALTAANNYSILETSPSLLFHQGHDMPTTFPQVNGQLWWDMDEQRQKLINHSGFSNNLCSFH